MKKLAGGLLFFFLAKLFVFAAPCVLADYQSAHSDYAYNYSLYRAAHNDYQVAKSSYSTYKTLASQNEAIKRMRTVLQTRDRVVSVYFDLLQEKLNQTLGVEEETRNTFSNIRASEKSWLASHETKIEAAGGLADLNSVSAEFEARFGQMDRETKQAVGNVLLGKEAVMLNKLEDLLSDLGDKIKEMRDSGEKTSSLERGMINIRDKVGLHKEKIDQGKKVFFGVDSEGKIDVFAGQQKLSEANQYLREAGSFLRELVKSITG